MHIHATRAKASMKLGGGVRSLRAVVSYLTKVLKTELGVLWKSSKHTKPSSHLSPDYFFPSFFFLLKISTSFHFPPPPPDYFLKFFLCMWVQVKVRGQPIGVGFRSYGWAARDFNEPLHYLPCLVYSSLWSIGWPSTFHPPALVSSVPGLQWVPLCVGRFSFYFLR